MDFSNYYVVLAVAGIINIVVLAIVLRYALNVSILTKHTRAQTSILMQMAVNTSETPAGTKRALNAILRREGLDKDVPMFDEK